MVKDHGSTNFEYSNLNSNQGITRLTLSSKVPGGILKKEDSSLPVKQPGSIKPGPLSGPPPSLKEWKASGNRGLPPVAYEIVIKDASNSALEYELYHGFRGQVSPLEIAQRLEELEERPKALHQRYKRSAIYYLQKKLEEYGSFD